MISDWRFAISVSGISFTNHKSQFTNRKSQMILVLASASPRRADLLRAAGFDFEIQSADADETVRPGELPEQYVRRVAEAKAHAVLPAAGDRPVIAADTVREAPSAHSPSRAASPCTSQLELPPVLRTMRTRVFKGFLAS